MIATKNKKKQLTMNVLCRRMRTYAREMRGINLKNHMKQINNIQIL